jgi:hypothetical protein
MATGMAGAAMLVASLSACGQSDEAFCDSLTEVRDNQSLTLDQVKDELSTLEDNAPDEVSDQVDTLVTETEQLFSSFEDAGIDDIGGKSLEDLGTNLSAEDQQKLNEAYDSEAFDSVDQEALMSASDDVQAWSNDNCPA